MKIVVPTLLVALSLQCAFAQTEVKIWTQVVGKNDDDPALGVATDPSGNAILCGGTHSILGPALNGRYDIFVTKFDSSGNQQWLQQRGTSEREFAEAVATDSSGNIYVTGYTGTNLDGQAYAGGFDIYLMKFDPNGNWLWTRQDGTSQDDDAHGVAVDSAGNIYITGYVRGNFHGVTRVALADIFISKYDPSGNRLWSDLVGSADVDEGFGISCDAANNVYVGGYVQAGVGTNMLQGVADNILVKWDSAGNRQWVKEWGTANNQTIYALKVDPSGNSYAAGYTTGSMYGPKNGGRDIILAKFDTDGNPVWGIQRGTTENDQAQAVTLDAAGNIYLAGKTSGSLDGNPYVAAEDVFVSKYNSSGTEIWTKELGGDGNDEGTGVAVDTNGGIFVGGWWTSTTFEGYANQGISDAFLMKYAPSNAPPPAPTANPATDVTTSGFTANWQNSSWAAGYRLDVSSNSSFSTYLSGYQNLDVSNVLQRTLSGLAPAKPFYYRVRAYNSNGISANSITISLATVAAGCSPAFVYNANFEGPTNAPGISTNWIGYQRPPLPSTVWSIQTAGPPPGGNLQYQQIANTSSAGGGGVRQDILGCAIGATYVISGWMRGNSALATCRVKVSPTASTDWNTAIDLNPPQFVSTNNWVPFSGTVVATSTNMTLWLDGTTGGSGQNKAECFDVITITCLGPVTPLYFLSEIALPQNQVSLVLTGAAGAAVTIQRSSDLSTWQSWTSLLNGSGTVQLTDTVAPGVLRRFYRATAP